MKIPSGMRMSTFQINKRRHTETQWFPIYCTLVFLKLKRGEKYLNIILIKLTIYLTTERTKTFDRLIKDTSFSCV